MRTWSKSLVVAVAVFLCIGVPSAIACPAPLTGASRSLALANANGTNPFYYSGGDATGTTNSGNPWLPSYSGFMSTDSNTYRFVNVNEQVFTMIGEGKHGLWRIQEAGFIREYLIPGKTGLKKGLDANDPKNLAIIKSAYASYIEGEGADAGEFWGGYHYPSDAINKDGTQNFVDVSITSAKYGGKYTNHVPIELPSWYCTMSGYTFPEAADAMGFAYKQKGPNKIGPLGVRAGLDISELYTNVLKLERFPDARSWVNVGSKRNVHWKAVDEKRTKAEYYLVERPFFNVPYLFVLAVYDNTDNGDFRYVRPGTRYYDSLVKRGYTDLKTTVTSQPRFALEKEGGQYHVVTGTELFGVNHPNRPKDNGSSGGGACPMKGGDWANYPNTAGGSAWPTQYEEITPLCDGVLLDIKFFNNLTDESWNNETLYLPNAASGSKTVNYKVKPGYYGKYTDPVLVAHGDKNPDAQQIYATIEMHFSSVRKPVGYRK